MGILELEINKITIRLDLEDYLHKKGLSGLRVVGNNIMARCPFHEDRRPSFGVSLESGVYQCFGCGAKGSFVNLVKHLEKLATEYDAANYLVRVYGIYSVDEDARLELAFEENKNSQYYIPESTLDAYRFRHPYLGARGISERVQRAFGVGYSKEHQAITIPWRDHHGRLVTVKMRRTFGKAFWYEPPMPPNIKKGIIWGLDKVVKWKYRVVAICEGEIDAMSIWQAEMAAVALGGGKLTSEQAKVLKKTLPPDVEIVVFTDNDPAGEQAKQSIIQHLGGEFLITQVDWTRVPGKKDANDLKTQEIKDLLKCRKEVGLMLDYQ